MTLAVSALLMAAVPASAAAADVTPPRILKAQTGDADADGRVDKVTVTYSEAIKHPAADSDGSYPFTVAGYAITRVGAVASSTTLTISLAEKAFADPLAKPAVSYTRGMPQPVRDLAGNEAIAQTFSWTFPIKALYVALTGNNANPGTQSAPKRTVNAAVATAVVTGARDVYVATGTFNEGAGVNIASLLTVTGGYRAGTWYRATTGATTIRGNPQALLADGDTGFTLRFLTLSGTSAGHGVYGVRAKGSSFTLINVRSMAAKGVDGTPGATPPGSAASGGDGVPGDPGIEDSSGICSTGSQPLGGGGGTLAGVPAASGGAGGNASKAGASGAPGLPAPAGTAAGSGTPPLQGNWNPPGQYLGSDGAAGAPGAKGSAGSGSYGSTGYSRIHGAPGAAGRPGKGGGGGGGGGGGTSSCDSYGGAGGGGGAGGAGGGGGGGGVSGGGSFAVYLWASTATIRNSVLTTGGGGNGGSGAAGQAGGLGGRGGWGGDLARPDAGNPYGGSQEQDDGSNGGRGGRGGAGGQGGAGGGGAGGPSVGVLLGGGSSATITGSSFALGSGGLGGPSSGNSGPNGPRANTLTK